LSLISICFFISSCDEKESSVAPVEEVVLENTLNNILTGQTGHIDHYFYDLGSEQINAKYYRYDKDAMENPQFYFQPSTDTLNFLTYPCYSMVLTQNNLTDTNEDGSLIFEEF